MKKIKFFAAAIAICGASLLGYNAYSNATMTEQERLFQQNLEALADTEEGGLGWMVGYVYVENGFSGEDCCMKSSINNSCNYSSVKCLTEQEAS